MPQNKNNMYFTAAIVALLLGGGAYTAFELNESSESIAVNTDKDKTPPPLSSKDSVDTSDEKKAAQTKNTDETAEKITVCSFNIQFLGSFKKRDDRAVASVLRDCDVAVVQELVSPPIKGVYPDGTVFEADKEAKEFFVAMEKLGFTYHLSEEDTGTGKKNHKNSTATEWWVAFVKNNRVVMADDLPTGFLADDRSDNPDYERVPYAFAFRTVDGKLDFVLISVHLQPGDKEEEKARRQHELQSIAAWIEQHNSTEKDFIILGDMNIYSKEELDAITPEGYASLNNECVRTNTLINEDADKGAKPYDHVMYNVAHTAGDIDMAYDFKVINLVEEMRGYWTGDEPYPGDPYDHNLFKQFYSDHHPVKFRMTSRKDDD